MMVQKQQGLEGQGYTFLRNALGGAIKDSTFISSLENQLDNFNKLFNNENDWSYMNSLSASMMPTLFDILDK
jgi:hypothetical protein